MDDRNIQKLRYLTGFEDLVIYLRDELDWPIDFEDAEDLDRVTFDYSTEDLGIDPKHAVKIETIKQIRPLVDGQQWGVFYIEFEPKRLPVVVLRRILHALNPSGRNSDPDRPAWKMGDLLFISAFGDESAGGREIAFAHFHQDMRALPTLRVLGWDGADTPLKLDYVARTLKKYLSWPDDHTDIITWQKQWAGAFHHRIGHVIRTANALAERLAILARGIRDAASTIMEHESEQGQLHRLHKAFQTALIHDMSEADFADTYAQTITYGLLTAAISRTDMSAGQYGTALVAENITDMVPITNPFLREMLQTFLQAGGNKGGINFDELGVQEVVELLRGEETDMPAILRDFNNRTPGEDPVIHFYEKFLTSYNKKIKIKRGVFYTPKPVVSYIVRSVHELLQSDFGLEDGLADTSTWSEMEKRITNLKRPATASPDSPFVMILDPAVGTATFLVEVIDVIYKTLISKWKKQGLADQEQKNAWNEYVPKHLLPRLFGYELMMAPYAIAHMKIPLKLKETGFTNWANIKQKDRVQIYLTNSLEEPHPLADKSAANLYEVLGLESHAVNEIKYNYCFTVIIGNPPYSTLSQNMGSWIKNLINDFRIINGKEIIEKGKRNHLQDDYVKFFRLSVYLIQKSGLGIIALITNHSFLDAPTFRGMRYYLIRNFSKCYFIDLNGNTKRGDQKKHKGDQNVFEIQQGVAISILTLTPYSTSKTEIFNYEIFGNRDKKFSLLTNNASTLNFQKICPKEDFFFLKPTLSKYSTEYYSWPKINEIMPFGGTGIKTNRDRFVIDFYDQPLLERMRVFRDNKIPDAKAKNILNLKENYTWKISKARKLFREDKNSDYLRDIEYRPFDKRRIYYQKNVVYNPRFKTMEQVKNNNIFLLTCRQQYSSGFRHAFVTQNMFECCIVSNKSREITSGFPLFIYQKKDTPTLFRERELNFSVNFLKTIRNKLKLEIVDLKPFERNSLEIIGYDVFFYIYSILYCPTYRERYEGFLKFDFPRIPITQNLNLFNNLSRLGEQLIKFHLLDLPNQNFQLINFIGEGNNHIEKKFPNFSNNTIFINSTQGFQYIPEDVWNFYIGGFQACNKWLKDRRGRELSSEDIIHYQKIIVAIKETIRLMGEIDEVIEDHGGWPIQ